MIGLFGLKNLARSDLLRSGTLVFAAQSAVNIMNFLFHIIVSRRIGVTAYGSLSALIAGLMVFVVPASILQTVLVKYTAEFRALGDLPHLRALLMRSFFVCLSAATGIMAVFVVAAPAIARYLHVGSTTPILLMSSVLALNFILPIRGFLQGVEDFHSFSISLVIEVAFKLALGAGFASLGWGINGALIGWAIGTLAAIVYTFAVPYIRYHGLPLAKLHVDMKRLVRTTASVGLAMLFVASLGFSDVILVKHFFDPRTAGFYGAAAIAGKMLFYLVNAVPLVVLARAANLTAGGKPSRPVLFQSLAIVALFSIAGLLIYFLFPEHVVGIITGAAFLPASPLLFPYAIAASLLGLLNNTVFYNIGAHRFTFILPLGAIAVVELIAISVFFHSSPLQVIYTLIACNAAALAVSFVQLPGRPQALSPVCG